LRFHIPLAQAPLSHGRDVGLGRRFSGGFVNSQQYCIPYQLDRWSEPPLSDSYEIVQNGHWLRRTEDSRADLYFRHNPLLLNMRFDGRSVESYVFMPRFFSSPINRPYYYVLHRSFDSYDWPIYMNKEIQRYAYPRTRVRYNLRRLDHRDPWEVKPIYIYPGYHPKVPKALLHPWDHNLGYLMIAGFCSLYYRFLDYSKLVSANTRLYFYRSFLTLNYRHLNSDLRVFCGADNQHRGFFGFMKTWWARGSSRLVADYLNSLYVCQMLNIQHSLLRFRLREKFSGGFSSAGYYSVCVRNDHRAYFTWVASLLDYYFQKCGALHISRAAPCHTRVLSSSGKLLDVSKQELVPSVLLDLQSILDDAEEMLFTSKSVNSSDAELLCQQYIDAYKEKFPPEKLVSRFNELMQACEKAK
jgi:hypothetical protein